MNPTQELDSALAEIARDRAPASRRPQQAVGIQIGRSMSSRRAGGGRQLAKKWTARRERRWAKLDPENAPRKRRFFSYY